MQICQIYTDQSSLFSAYVYPLIISCISREIIIHEVLLCNILDCLYCKNFCLFFYTSMIIVIYITFIMAELFDISLLFMKNLYIKKIMCNVFIYFINELKASAFLHLDTSYQTTCSTLPFVVITLYMYFFIHVLIIVEKFCSLFLFSVF